MTISGGDTGDGVLISGGDTSGDGVEISAPTSGHGVRITAAGASKHGLLVAGGNSGTSDGLKAVAGTGGVDIRGNITGNLTGTINGLTATAVADLFDTDSGTNYAAAHANSVVKQIADNAGGSALTEAGIADAVWDELTSEHVVVGSFGEHLGDALTQTYFDSLIDGANTFGEEMDIQGYTAARADQIDYLTGDAFVRLGAPAGVSVSADIAAIEGGGGGTTVSPAIVDEDHKWWFQYPDDLTAANTIYELIAVTGTAIGFNGLLAMEFEKVLPEGTSINRINLVDIQPPGLIITSQTVSTNHKEVHIGVSTTGTALPEEGMYMAIISVISEDEQETTRQGRLFLRRAGV